MIESSGEIFYTVANNPFGLYIFYLDIYLSSNLYFNLLKPVSEAITDNYLSEHCCGKEVSKRKKKELKMY